MCRLKVISYTLIALSMATANAQPYAKIGRYVQTAVSPRVDQRDLLAQMFVVKFPKSIVNIHGAIKHLLSYSGYRLVGLNKLSPSVKQMLSLPLPEVDRELGPLTLEQGLQVLAGKPFQLIVDPVHRLIAYRLKPRYRQLLEVKK